jgi:hypothetical protein
MIENMDINGIFDQLLIWNNDYRKLGFDNIDQLAGIHKKWRMMSKGTDIKIHFKKPEIKKLNIVFEGE